MNELVFVNGRKTHVEPFTTSEVIAVGAGMNHRRVRDSIRKYQTNLETFGKVGAYATTLQSGQDE